MPSGEDELIARYFRPLATAPGAFSLTDDAATFSPPAGYETVLKTDAIVAGVHFLTDDPPDSVARKSLRVNLSDLAAKGATPAGCLMTLALPGDISDGWLADFAAGLKDDCERYGCPLYGGDTVRTPGPVSISIFAFGVLPFGTMVRRAGAKSGDRVFATGSIGDAALGLQLRLDPARKLALGLTDVDAKFLVDRYRLPRPRVALHEAVRAYASASMDISDGLMGDLGKLCAASGASARIEATRLPLSSGARQALRSEPALIEPIATGGDDYEILCAIPSAHVQEFRQAAEAVSVPVTDIGEIVTGSGAPQLVTADGNTLAFARLSFSHFR
jgi:thiamine-monophosphate kinase